VKQKDFEAVVMGFKYKVRFLGLPKETWGESDQGQKLIHIQKTGPLSTQVETYYHEVAHMILHTTGVTQILTAKQEEAVCQSLGIGIAQFVTENEWLPMLNGEVKKS
jgi:hypothetical protein